MAKSVKKEIVQEIREYLFTLQDREYRDFQSKLFPTVEKDSVIGVRTPELRKYAKQWVKKSSVREFLDDLPHQYFDENQLHGFIISEIKDYETCLRELQQFLPYVDNWATCDQMSPKIFKKHRPELLAEIERWIASDQTYTVRFGIGMLLQHFLEDDFDPRFLEMVSQIQSDEYYIKMMVAWYFATALAKQWGETVPYIEEQRLVVWTHNKTIQKAVESYRITKEQKAYLRGYKVKA